MQTSSREPAERAPLAREAGSAGPRSGLRWPAERARGPAEGARGTPTESTDPWGGPRGHAIGPKL